MVEPSTLRRAGQWLAHPASVVAVLVLILNDHVLKQAYGNWWTGKISDVAGLIFFPALVALVIALLGSKFAWRPVVLTAVAITALGFAWVKATSVGAAAASDLLSALAGPSLVRQDATDLLAIPFLAIAAVIAMRPATRGAWRVAVVLPIAVLATAATSPADTSVYGVSTVETRGGKVLAGEADLTMGEPRVHEWWLTGPGADFTRVPNPDAIHDVPPTGIACTADGVECYRPYDGYLGVQRSTDSGVTWTVDWQISDEQQEAIVTERGLYGDSGDPEYYYAATREVAVLMAGSKYYVYAANGIDGVSMRSPDGTWERIGKPGIDTWWPADELPPLHVTADYQDHFARWLVASFALLVAAMTIGGVFVFRAGARKASQPWWIVGASATVFPWLAIAVVVYDVADFLLTTQSVSLPSATIAATLSAACAAIIAVGMLVANPRKGLAGIGAVLAIATVSGFVAGAVDATFVNQLLVGGAVALALTAAAAAAFLRWLASEPTPRDQATALAEGLPHPVQ